MKIRNKLFVGTIFAAAVVCSAAVSVCASEQGTLSNTAFEASQGDNFSTIIYMKSGSNILDFQAELEYNTEYVELVSASAVDGLVGNMEIGTDTEGKVSVNYTRVSGNMTNDTQLMTLTFKINDELSDGSYNFLTLSQENKEAHSMSSYALDDAAINADFSDVVLYGTGDVNMDGKISIADATYIRQSLVNMRTLSDSQRLKADTVGTDGTVTIDDATRIQQKLIYDGLVLGDRATVTFYVDGEVYAKKSVKIGSELKNIPNVPHKEGYDDGSWDVTDFSDISTSISVNAVYGYTGQTEAGKATYAKVLEALDTGFIQSGKYVADNFQLPYKNTYGTFNMLSSSEFDQVDILWSIDSGLLAQSVVIGNDYIVTVPELDYTTSVTFTAYVYIDGVLYGTQAFDREIKGKIDLPNSNAFKDIIDAIPSYDIADAPKIGLVDEESKSWKDTLSKEYGSYENYFYKNMESYRLPGSVSLESDRTNYGVKIVQDIDIVWTLKDGNPKGFDSSKNQLIYLKDENPVTLKASFMFDGYCVYSQTITRTIPAKTIEEQKAYAEEYLSKYVPSLLSGESLFPYQINLYDLTVTWRSGSASGKIAVGSNKEYKDELYTPVSVGTKAGYLEWGTLIARVERNGDKNFRAVEYEYPIQLAGDSTEINHEKIPDVNLYKALLKTFDTKYGNDDGILTEEEIYDTEVAEKLDYTIDLSNMDIENLAGVDYLVRYRSLNLSGNKLGGTDAHLGRLSGLVNLEQLNLSKCNISEIPRTVFASMYAIEGIDISYNNLEDLSFLDQNRKFTELTDLLAQGNDISDISALNYENGSGETVSTIPNAKRLTLSRKLDSENEAAMDITPLGLANKLSVLWLANNDIADITPLANCTLLTVLDLSNNKISAPNANNDGLKPLEKLQSLICLMLDNNDITTVRSLRKLTDLQELSLSNNNIGSVDSLTSLTQLSYLDLDNNKLTAFNVGSYPNLNFLFMENNNIEQIVGLTTASDLYQLRLSYNNISNPDTYKDISSLTNLAYLSLSGNTVGSLDFLSDLKALQHLELDNCAIYQYYETIDSEGNTVVCDNLDEISGLTSLAVLDLSQNSAIKNITALSELTNLKALYLDGVLLDYWSPLSRMTGLKYLSMQNSGVKDIDFTASLTGLVYLNLSGHSSPEVNFNNFRYYENIESLYLDSAVECTAYNSRTGLANATNLRYLSLRNINVGSIDNLPDMDVLRYLNIENTGITDYLGTYSTTDGYIYAVDRFDSLEALCVRENENLFTKDNLNFLYDHFNGKCDVYLYTTEDLPYEVFHHEERTDDDGKRYMYLLSKDELGSYTDSGYKLFEDYTWGTFDADLEIEKIKPNIDFAITDMDISEAIIDSASDTEGKGYKLPDTVNGFDLEWSMDEVKGCFIENNTLYYIKGLASADVNLDITATVKDLYHEDYPVSYDVRVEYGSQTITYTYTEEEKEHADLTGCTLDHEEDPVYSEYGDWSDQKDAHGHEEETRTLYRYYYIKCPTCGGKMGIYGHSSSDSRIKTVECFSCHTKSQMSSYNLVTTWSDRSYDDVAVSILNGEAEYTFDLGDVWFTNRFGELTGSNEKTQYRYKSIVTPKTYIYSKVLTDGLSLKVGSDATVNRLDGIMEVMSADGETTDAIEQVLDEEMTSSSEAVVDMIAEDAVKETEMSQEIE